MRCSINGPRSCVYTSSHVVVVVADVHCCRVVLFEMTSVSICNSLSCFVRVVKFVRETNLALTCLLQRDQGCVRSASGSDEVDGRCRTEVSTKLGVCSNKRLFAIIGIQVGDSRYNFHL